MTNKVEVLPPQTDLATVIKDSGLQPAKAAILQTRFNNFFTEVAEWEQKAKSLVVTDINQKEDIKAAREGRIFLKGKRVEVEKTRKELKEQVVREGKAIDGVANVLKSLIAPIEEHLAAQENFAARKEAERIEAMVLLRKEELLAIPADPEQYDLENLAEESYVFIRDGLKQQRADRIKAEQDAEAARIQREKDAEVKAEEQRLENIKLKEANAKAEAEAEASRVAKEKAEAATRRAKAKVEANAKKIQAEAAEKARVAKEEADAEIEKVNAENRRLAAEAKAKEDAEAHEKAKAEADKQAEAQRVANAGDLDKLRTLLKYLDDTEVPTVDGAQTGLFLDGISEELNDIVSDLADEVGRIG